VYGTPIISSKYIITHFERRKKKEKRKKEKEIKLLPFLNNTS